MAVGTGTLLHEAMPTWDVRERHARLVHAPVQDVWDALLATRVGDLPLSRALMAVRTLGRHDRGSGDRPAVAAMPPGEIGRREPTELLFGLVMPATLRLPAGGLEALRPVSVAALRRPLPDGWARVGTDLRLVARPDGTALLTETRVLATGTRARRFFRLYWTAIRPGSGAVRRELLRAVAHRAEAAAVARG
jgi:hypothetical protein